MQKHVKNLQTRIARSDNSEITIDFKNEIMVTAFNDISNYIILGDSEEVSMTKIDGKNLSAAIKESI